MVTQQGMVPVAVKIIQYKQGKSVAASKAEVAREVQILKLMWHKPYWLQQVSPELQFVGEQFVGEQFGHTVSDASPWLSCKPTLCMLSAFAARRFYPADECAEFACQAMPFRLV